MHSLLPWLASFTSFLAPSVSTTFVSSFSSHLHRDIWIYGQTYIHTALCERAFSSWPCTGLVTSIHQRDKEHVHVCVHPTRVRIEDRRKRDPFLRERERERAGDDRYARDVPISERTESGILRIWCRNCAHVAQIHQPCRCTYTHTHTSTKDQHSVSQHVSLSLSHRFSLMLSHPTSLRLAHAQMSMNVCRCKYMRECVFVEVHTCHSETLSVFLYCHFFRVASCYTRTALSLSLSLSVCLCQL